MTITAWLPQWPTACFYKRPHPREYLPKAGLPGIVTDTVKTVKEAKMSDVI